MKTLFAFFAILGIAGGILAFCFFSPVIAAFALFLYLLVGGGFVFSFAYNHGLRKKMAGRPHSSGFSGIWRLFLETDARQPGLVHRRNSAQGRLVAADWKMRSRNRTNLAGYGNGQGRKDWKKRPLPEASESAYRHAGLQLRTEAVLTSERKNY